MKILLIVLLVLGSAFVIALLITAILGIELIEKTFEFIEGDDNNED